MSVFHAEHPLTGEALCLPSEPLPLPHPSFHSEPCDDLLSVLLSEVVALPAPRIVGVVGAAAAGKTTLCEQLYDALSARGLSVTHLHGDDYTLPGPGHRYELVDGVRRDRVVGPAIYDHDALHAALVDAAGRSDVVLVDSVLLGWHPPTADLIRLLVGLHLGEAERLRRKILRDHERPSRRHGLIADFTRKQRDEVRPMHEVLARRADLVWDASKGLLYRRS